MYLFAELYHIEEADVFIRLYARRTKSPAGGRPSLSACVCAFVSHNPLEGSSTWRLSGVITAVGGPGGRALLDFHNYDGQTGLKRRR
ncbi:hypothetical protein EVAR_10056_1 [Eumeta japonica]|uniref:Uncharacterized protein n=1 Tax=Eumeta variegata TaxID=151549 RepID=A0A4C1TR72_EUMVA|nr:hypothetical protein EVAR_10056_1 [Eumeta japonica]